MLLAAALVPAPRARLVAARRRLERSLDRERALSQRIRREEAEVAAMEKEIRHAALVADGWTPVRSGPMEGWSRDGLTLWCADD